MRVCYNADTREVDLNLSDPLEIPAERITEADVSLLVGLAANFDATVGRLPNGGRYIQEQRDIAECRRLADLGHMTLL